MQSKILVELQESMGSDVSIANAAWTSTYDKDRREDKYDDPQKVSELVPRLIREGHSVPLESVIFRFWIRMPIFVDRQHMTHRVASHNGLSGRYRTMPFDWFPVPNDVSDILKKAGSACDFVAAFYEQSCAKATENYKFSIAALKNSEKEGIITNAEFKRAREILRGQLPTAGMVERTTILNLRSFANYQRLRNSVHAQPEIQQVAQLMLEEVKKHQIAPLALNTLEQIEWGV